LSLLGDQQMQFETVKETSFARLIAAPLWTTVQMAAANPIVITGSYRESCRSHKSSFHSMFSKPRPTD
jgi:hypothetical protein